MTPNSLYDIAPITDALGAGVPVLTPNARLARCIRQAWGDVQLAQGRQCWESPPVMPLDQWWQRCYEQLVLRGETLPALLTPQQELTLWQRIVAAHPKSNALLRPRGAAMLARDARHNLLLWQLDWHSQPLASHFEYDQDAKLFRDWADAFEQALRDHNLTTLVDIAPRLAAGCPEGELVLVECDDLPPLHAHLLRVQTQAQAEAQPQAQPQTQNQAQPQTQNQNPKQSQSQAQAQKQTRAKTAAPTQTKTQPQGQVREHHQQRPPGTQQLLACDTEREELLRAGRWVAARLAEDPSCTVGVLVPGLEQRRETVLQQLGEGMGIAVGSDFGDRNLPLNISVGPSLLASGPVRAALALLALPWQDTPVADLGALLHSRYRSQEQREGEQRLLRRLYRHGRRDVAPAQLRRECAEIAPSPATPPSTPNRKAATEQGDDGTLQQGSKGRGAFAANPSTNPPSTGLALGQRLQRVAGRRALRDKHPPSVWVGHFRDCLQTLGWLQGTVLDSVEYRQVEHFHQAMEQLGELDPVCEPLSLDEALQLLRQVCADYFFPPRTGDHRVQVLKMHEARGLAFDHLWICSMSNALWPPPPNPNPFIPNRVQVEHGLPHANAQRELDYARALMGRLRDSGADTVASYVRQAEDAPQLPSPLVEDFEPFPATRGGKRGDDAPQQPHQGAALNKATGIKVAGGAEGSVSPWPEVWSSLRANAHLETLADHAAPPLADGEPVRGGSGLLTDQSLCPFRAFATHRLGARPLEELESALSAAERGTILHQAMFQLWGEIGGSEGLARLSPARQGKLIAAAAEGAVAAARADLTGNDAAADRHLHALLSAEQRRLQPVLAAWLELEREREGFTVAGREELATVEVAGLTLKLRLDRYDRLADGGLFLIDYKSGARGKSAWLGRRPSQPQLPLYVLALEGQGEGQGGNVAAIAFGVANGRECAFTGVGGVSAAKGVDTQIDNLKERGLPVAEDWVALKARWRQDLTQLAQDFVAGRAEVDPAEGPQTCARCGLQSLCRVGG